MRFLKNRGLSLDSDYGSIKSALKEHKSKTTVGAFIRLILKISKAWTNTRPVDSISIITELGIDDDNDDNDDDPQWSDFGQVVFFSDFANCPMGVYNVFWQKDGEVAGSSFALIGKRPDGKKWMSAINWPYAYRRTLGEVANNIHKMVLIKEWMN